MTPAEVRAALITRSLERVGTVAGMWLASAAATALAWRPGPDGPELRPPSHADVDALASLPEAEHVAVVERVEVLALLRAIVGGGS